jgi:hypothetical protein
MIKTMRTLKIVAAVALLALVASSASASTISLIWRKNSSDTLNTSTLATGENLLADVVLTADAAGISGVFISFSFDNEGLNMLDFDSFPFGGSAVGGYELPLAPPGKSAIYSPIVTGVTLNESAIGLGGTILGFDEANASGGAVSSTVTLGSLSFSYTGVAGSTAVTPFLNPGIIDAVLTNAGTPITPTFESAFIVPEPTTGLLIVAGLAGLGYAGRRSIR